MDIPPVALLLLLGFGLLIAVCLTAWTATSLEAGLREPTAGERAAAVKEDNTKGSGNRAANGAKERGSRASNRGDGSQAAKGAKDSGSQATRTAKGVVEPGRRSRTTREDSATETVRVREKARAAPSTEKQYEEDAFERFLRAGPDDTDLR